MRKLAFLILSCAALRAQNPPSYNQLRIIPNPTRTAVGVEQFFEKSQSHYIGLSAPDTVTANVTFRLPNADGTAGSCLSTNGTAALNWAGCSNIDVSPTFPDYLYYHFRDDDSTKLYMSHSRDAFNYADLNPSGTFVQSPSNRDPSVLYKNGLFYISASPDGVSSGTKIQIWTTPDHIHFDGPHYLDVYPSFGGGVGCCSFAPEWFEDPVSGDDYLISTNSNDGGVTFTWWFMKMDLSTLTPTVVTNVVVNGTTQQTNFDNYMFYDAATSTYYITYVDLISSPFQQYVVWATSSTLVGPYTQVPASGVDAMGFSAQSEAPSVLQLPLGTGAPAPVSNGDFESGALTPWVTFAGSGSVVTSPVHGGTYSLSENPASLIYNDVTVTPLSNYVAFAWVQSTTALPVAIVASDSLNPASTVVFNYTPSATWSLISVPFTSSATGILRVQVQTGAGSGTATWDDVTVMPADCLRVNADTWVYPFNRGPSFNAGDGRKYLVKYRDSCRATPTSPRFESFEGQQPDPISISAAEHGTVLKIVDPIVAQTVFNAVDYYHNTNNQASRQALGNANPFFTFNIFSKNANGNLQYNEAPTYAATQSNGDASVWSGCGTTDVTCPTPFAGNGKWVVNHNGGGGSGIIQLNNANSETGEASILYGNSIYSFGGLPLDASSLGKKALWTCGENNQFFGSLPVGQNIANNWWFCYNGGLGGLVGSNPTVANPGFESGSFSGWTAAGSTAVQSILVHNGSFAAELGPGGSVTQTISGLTNGTTYEFIMWVQTAPGAGIGGNLYIDDGTGGNAATGLPFLSVGSWYQIGTQYTANATTNARIRYEVNAGATADSFLDDVQFYVLNSPVGSFPLGISPSSGEVRANYGVTFGGGDSTSLDSADWAGLYATSAGFLSLSNNGLFNNREGALSLGTLSVGTASGDSLFWGSNAAMYSTGSGFVNLGVTGSDREAALSLGSLSIGPVSGDALFFGSDAAMYATASGFVNLGVTTGDREAALSVGSLSVGLMSGDALYFNADAAFYATSPGFISLANNGSTANREGALSLGVLSVGTSSGDALYMGSNINMDSPALGKLNIGHGTYGQFDAFVRIGELSNGGGNTDLVGKLVINTTGGACGGSATCTGFTFVHSGAYSTAPGCIFYDPGSSFSPQATVSTTGFLVFAPLGDNIVYHCIFVE